MQPNFKTIHIGDLEWQVDPPKPMPWDHAVEYAAMIDKAFGGGWRLPTVQELVGLWDYDKSCCPAFPNADGWYWSSSPDGGGAWLVSFDGGHLIHSHRDGEVGARCVRTVQKGE
jgi:hypothetical protein